MPQGRFSLSAVMTSAPCGSFLLDPTASLWGFKKRWPGCTMAKGRCSWGHSMDWSYCASGPGPNRAMPLEVWRCFCAAGSKVSTTSSASTAMFPSRVQGVGWFRHAAQKTLAIRPVALGDSCSEGLFRPLASPCLRPTQES